MRPFHDRVGLPSDEAAALQAALADLATLGEVVRWGIEQRPPRLVSDVIKQDEYTLDVVLPIDAGRYLVFDCT